MPLHPTSTLTPLVRRLKRSLSGAMRQRNSEHIHTARVTIRKIEAWLELAGVRVLRDDLRWLRRRTGRFRDIDVLLARLDLPSQAVAQLSEEFVEAEKEMRHTLGDQRTQSLLAALDALPPLSKASARSRSGAVARRTVRAAEQLARNQNPIDAMHRLRRRVKLLRYALEWMGHRSRALAKLQTHLGELNDLAVLARTAQALPGRNAESRAFAQRIEHRLESKTADMFAVWKKLSPSLLKELKRWTSI